MSNEVTLSSRVCRSRIGGMGRVSRCLWVVLTFLSIAATTTGATGFADPNLQAAVESAIGRPAVDWTPEDLGGLTVLTASGRGITDLTGIESLTNLVALDLADNQVTDLSPLANLTCLTHLILERNKVTDLSPLMSLSHLQVLLLLGNQVTDLVPLLAMPALVEVDVRGNPLSAAALADQIPALQRRRIEIRFDPPSTSDDEDPDLLPWRFVGPTTEPWEVGVYQVIPAPSDPAILYAQTQTGLWRSEDGGKGWTATGMMWGGLEYPEFIVDPLDAFDLYCDGLDLNTGQHCILHSRDGGEHWETMATTWPGGCENEDNPAGSLLAVDPVREGRLYGLSCSRLVISNDDGQNWTEACDWAGNPIRTEMGEDQLFVHTATPRALYLITIHGNSGRSFLSRSIDGGDHWESRFETRPHLMTIAGDPRNPEALYGTDRDSVYHSTDGGRSWLGVARAPATSLHQLMVSTADPGMLIAATTWYGGDGGPSGWISRDYGSHWEQLPVPGAAWIAVLKDQDRSLLAVTSSSQVDPGWLWSSRDLGHSWDPARLAATARPVALVRCEGMGRLYAGSGHWVEGKYEPELWESDDGGQHWRQLLHAVSNPGIELYPGWRYQPGLGPVEELIWLPGQPIALLAQTRRWPIASRDYGSTWSIVDPGMSWTAPVDHPRPFAAGEDLYLLTAGGVLFLCGDGGGTWRSLQSLVTVATAVPREGGRLYVHRWLDSNLLYSDDQGATWTRTGAMPSMGRPLDLAVHPRDPGRLYGVNYLGLAASDDGGRSWHLLLASSMVAPGSMPRIRFDERDSSRVFYVTGRQVLESQDRGVTWRSIGKGIANYAWISDVAVDPADPTLIYAATPRGVYRLDADAPITAVFGEQRTIPETCFLQQNYPNPFNAETTIAYQLSSHQRVSLVIYDVLGRPVRHLATGEQASGEYRLIWDGRDAQGREVGSGVYLCRLTTPAATSTRRLLLLK